MNKKCKKIAKVENFILATILGYLDGYISRRKAEKIRENECFPDEIIMHLLECTACLNGYVKLKKKYYLLFLKGHIPTFRIVDGYLRLAVDHENKTVSLRDNIAKKIWLEQEEGDGKTWNEFVGTLINKKKGYTKHRDKKKISYFDVCEGFDKWLFEAYTKKKLFGCKLYYPIGPGTERLINKLHGLYEID